MNAKSKKESKKRGYNAKPPKPPMPPITNDARKGEGKANGNSQNRDESHVFIETIPPVHIKKDFVNISIQALIALCALISPIIVWTIATNQNRLAKDTFYVENRPYIFSGNPTAILSVNKQPIMAELPIINYGHLPAYKTFGVYRFNRLTYIPLPDTFSRPPDSLARIIPPHSTDILKVWLDTITIDKSDTAGYYLTGKFWYTDYWNVPHYASFVYRYYFNIGGFVRHYEYDKADTNKL